ncbi:MAG: hypothetical protein ABIN24_02815 [Dyadobacter sp.]
MKIRILLFCVFALALSGCDPTPDFNTVPSISYNSIGSATELDSNGKKIRENVTISIDFEDGDGNLGATESEINDYVNFRPPYGNWGNYELITARFENNKWVERIMTTDSIKFFPLLKVDGKIGPIKGKLDLHTTAFYTNNTKPVLFKFKVRIRDRSLHVSNQVVTDSLYLPYYQ